MLEDKHGIYADLEDKVVDKEKDIVDDDRNSDQKQHYSLQRTLHFISVCHNHRIANSYGQPTTPSFHCPCCNKPISKQPLPYFFTPDQLFHTGNALPLYFSTLKLLILTLSLLTSCFTPLFLYLNSQGTACTILIDPPCSPTLFLKLSALNTSNDVSIINLQTYILFLCVIIIFIMCQFARKCHRDIVKFANICHHFPDQYAVLLRMPPTLPYNQTGLIGQIIKWWKKQHQRNNNQLIIKFPQLYQHNLQSQNSSKSQTVNDSPLISIDNIIQKVIISYSIPQLQLIKSQLHTLQQAILASNSTQTHNQLVGQYTQLKQKLQVSLSKTNKCIVIFRLPKYQKYFLEKNNQSIFQRVLFFDEAEYFEIDQQRVTVSPAPLPSEILWENHHHSFLYKTFRRIIVWLAALIALGLGQALAVGILDYWLASVRNQGQNIQQYFSFLVSLLIIAINYLLYLFLSYLTNYQAQPTTTHSQISKVLKTFLVIFIDSGLVLLLSYLILDIHMVWTYNGFIDTLSYSFILTILTPHLYKYLNWSILKHCYYRLTMTGNQPITQQTANTNLTPPPHNLSDNYTYSINLIYWSCFFAPLLPFSFLCILLSLIIHYYLQRLNIIKLHSQNFPQGSQLNLFTIQMLQKSTIMLAWGNLSLQLIFANLYGRSHQPTPLYLNIALIIGSMYSFILPNQKISKLITCKSSSIQQSQYHQHLNTNYSTIKSTFIQTYQQHSPYHKLIKQINNSKLSQRIKMIEQLSTMSKTLSMSLKQRLLGTPVLPLERHYVTENKADVSMDMYYEYQKKIDMPAFRTKMKVPPLFKKKDVGRQNDQKKMEEEPKELINLGVMFQGREKVKREIRKQLKNSIKKLDSD